MEAGGAREAAPGAQAQSSPLSGAGWEGWGCRACARGHLHSEATPRALPRLVRGKGCAAWNKRFLYIAGDMSSRHFKPEIRVTSLRFSPTGEPRAAGGWHGKGCGFGVGPAVCSVGLSALFLGTRLVPERLAGSGLLCPTWVRCGCPSSPEDSCESHDLG